MEVELFKDVANEVGPLVVVVNAMKEAKCGIH